MTSVMTLIYSTIIIQVHDTLVQDFIKNTRNLFHTDQKQKVHVIFGPMSI